MTELVARNSSSNSNEVPEMHREGAGGDLLLVAQSLNASLVCLMDLQNHVRYAHLASKIANRTCTVHHILSVNCYCEEMSKRTRTTLVNAFNLVPVVEQILPDRQKIEVG